MSIGEVILRACIACYQKLHGTKLEVRAMLLDS